MASETDLRPEFTIVSGAHRGATFTLNADLLLIGADAACDVWLSDAGLAARHVALMAEGRGVAIRPLEGSVSVDGQLLTAASRVVLSPGSEIILGDTGVRLQLGGGAAVGEDKIGTREHASAGSAEGGADKSASSKASVRAKARNRTIMASLLVVAGLLAVGFATQQLRPTGVGTARASNLAASATLSDAELVVQIRDVFRTHGYDAEVTHLGPASVRIENLEASHERVRRATTQARADIPQLKSLTFASPDAAEPPAEAPLYDDSPTDRMSLHVDDATAYIALRDGRYFVGSTLPNGDTIRRIHSGAVLVERDGQVAWFRF